MSRAARTLFVYAVAFGAGGIAFLIAPNLFLPLFGFAVTQEPWIHFVGLLMVSLAAYDLLAARMDIEPIIQASVPMRMFAGLVMIGTWLLDMVGPGILLFATFDMVSAGTTMMALRGTSLVRA